MKVLGILFFILLTGCQPTSYRAYYEKKQNGAVFEETCFSPGIPAHLTNTLTALVIGQKETLRIKESYSDQRVVIETTGDFSGHRRLPLGNRHFGVSAIRRWR